MSDTEAKDSEGESDDSDTAVTASEGGSGEHVGAALPSTVKAQVQETADLGKLPHPKVMFLLLKLTFSCEKKTFVALCLAGTASSVSSTVHETACLSEGKASLKVFRNGIKEEKNAINVDTADKYNDLME